VLARDRQIPALYGKIGASDGDLAIPSEQTIGGYLRRRVLDIFISQTFDE
jgi:hypothetical protein